MGRIADGGISFLDVEAFAGHETYSSQLRDDRLVGNVGRVDLEKRRDGQYRARFEGMNCVEILGAVAA